MKWPALKVPELTVQLNNSSMRKQVNTFFAALMFLTRLPIPKWVAHKDVYLQKSTKYFTLVGMLVGIFVAITYSIGNIFFSNTVAVVLSMISGIFITGAFHEDGFADVCDSFGGGWTKETILTIMKDSRLGTYGTVGLIFILLLKFLLLVELSTISWRSGNTLFEIDFRFSFPILMVVGHSLSRLMPLLVIQRYDYVFQDDKSKSKPLASQKLTVPELLFAFLIALVGFLFLPYYFLFTIIFMMAITFLLGNYFKKWIGGYTGDCLGTVQQVAEIIFYLTIIMATKLF
jgi:adenosylcobinamide-GDP ribazoletransferase